MERYWPWSMRLVCTAMAIALMIANSEAASAPKRIVFLHSYSQNFKPWSEYAKALRKELYLQSDWPLFIEDFSVVTGRTEHDENAEANFVGYLSALFSSQPPDMIIAFGGPAAVFVQRHRHELFPTTPMLLTAVDQRRDGPNGERHRGGRSTGYSCSVPQYSAGSPGHKNGRRRYG